MARPLAWTAVLAAAGFAAMLAAAPAQAVNFADSAGMTCLVGDGSNGPEPACQDWPGDDMADAVLLVVTHDGAFLDVAVTLVGADPLPPTGTQQDLDVHLAVGTSTLAVTLSRFDRQPWTTLLVHDGDTADAGPAPTQAGNEVRVRVDLAPYPPFAQAPSILVTRAGAAAQPVGALGSMRYADAIEAAADQVVPCACPPPTTPTPTTGPAPTSTNRTATNDGERLPGMTPVAVLAAVGAAALVARRRLF